MSLPIAHPFIVFYPAITLSAWLGGLWPGIITTSLCAVAAEYLWLEPGHSWGMSDRSDLIALLIFVGVGGLISALNEAWRRGAAALVDAEHAHAALLTKEHEVRTEAEATARQLQAALEAGRMGTWQFTMGTEW